MLHLVAATGDQTALQEALESVHGTPRSRVGKMQQLLRARTSYLSANQPGSLCPRADAYCHFTSQLGRYPDVIVHCTQASACGRMASLRAELSALPDLQHLL